MADSASVKPPQIVRDAWDAMLDRIFGDAYRLGYQAGMEAMRGAILAAAQAPTPDAMPTVAFSTGHATVSSVNKQERAPRGSVRKATIEALRRAKRGLTTEETAQGALAIDPNVSPRSVAGELNRMRDRFYLNQSGLWFLMNHVVQKEAAGASPAAVSTSDAQEAPDDPDTTIAA